MAALAVALLAAPVLAWGARPATAPPSALAETTILQPSLKRSVYVFLDRFTDRGNTTTPAEITARLDAVNAYFSAVTDGAWTFNWTLFYPALGQPWYMVNETYAQAASSSNLTPLADVVMAAYDSGVRFPAPGTYPLVPSALIIHAGDDGAMTGNTTDLWSVTTGPYCSGFRTSPPNAFCLLTAIVAETDPVGVIAHELTHELQRFDEYGDPMGITLQHSSGALPSGMVPVDWWDPMYQGLRNPTNNASIAPGTYPSEFMAWDRMSLGFLPLSQIAVVDRGRSATVTVNDLEEPTTGDVAIRIPVVNTTAYHAYYVVELRKGVSYDAYFPWLTSIYPDRTGLLVYWINVTQYGQPWQVFLIKAHATDINAQQALFGPCSAPCTASMVFADAANRVNVTIASTSSSAFVVRVNNAVSGSSIPGGSNPTPPSGCTGPTCFLGSGQIGDWGVLVAAILIAGTCAIATTTVVRRRRARRARNRVDQASEEDR